MNLETAVFVGMYVSVHGTVDGPFDTEPIVVERAAIFRKRFNGNSEAFPIFFLVQGHLPLSLLVYV